MPNTQNPEMHSSGGKPSYGWGRGVPVASDGSSPAFDSAFSGGWAHNFAGRPQGWLAHQMGSGWGMTNANKDHHYMNQLAYQIDMDGWKKHWKKSLWHHHFHGDGGQFYPGQPLGDMLPSNSKQYASSTQGIGSYRSVTYTRRGQFKRQAILRKEIKELIYDQPMTALGAFEWMQWTFYPVKLYNIRVGDGEDERIGRQINVKRLECHWTMAHQVLNADIAGGGWYRLELWLDTASQGNTVPQEEDVYANTGVGKTGRCLTNILNAKRFKRIWAGLFASMPQHVDGHSHAATFKSDFNKAYINVNRNITFHGDTGLPADLQTESLFWAISAQRGAEIDMRERIVYCE